MLKVISSYIHNIKDFVQEDVDLTIGTLVDFKELYQKIWNSDVSKGQKILGYILLGLDSLFVSVVTLVCISSVILIKVVMALVLILGMIPYQLMIKLLERGNTQ